jgi:hypothetical protein
MYGHLSSLLGELLGRIDGPMHLRIFMQPVMAILLAMRDGSRDARAGRGAYGWTVLTDAAQRRYLLQDGWKGISKVFLVACVLDVIYQLIALHGLRPLQTLIVASILAVIPYALLRGPANRIMRRRRNGASHGSAAR